MNWHRPLLFLDASRAMRFAVATAVPALALYLVHLARHKCICGHLAHESHRVPVPLDFAWWLLFSSSLVATLFIRPPKLSFYGFFVVTIILSEILLVTAPVLLLGYYLLARQERTPRSPVV